MRDETSHPISSSFRRQNALASVIGLALAIGAVVWLLVDPALETGGRVLMGTLGLIAALATAWCAWFVATTARKTVVVRDDGLRVGKGPWIPWPAIARLRPRGALQRIDLVGHDGERLASIEHQVEGAHDLVDLVFSRTRREPRASLGRRFGRRYGPVFLAGIASFLIVFGAVGWYLWPTQNGWLAVVLSFVCMSAAYDDLRNHLRELELRDEGLVLRTVLRERTVPGDRIERMVLSFERHGGSQILTAVAVLRDGAPLKVCPAGQDPQEVHAAVSAWLHGDHGSNGAP